MFESVFSFFAVHRFRKTYRCLVYLLFSVWGEELEEGLGRFGEDFRLISGEFSDNVADMCSGEVPRNTYTSYNPRFKLINKMYVFNLTVFLTNFSDSSPFQPAICTVLHAESESGVKMDGIQHPGAKI